MITVLEKKLKRKSLLQLVANFTTFFQLGKFILGCKSFLVQFFDPLKQLCSITLNLFFSYQKSVVSNLETSMLPR